MSSSRAQRTGPLNAKLLARFLLRAGQKLEGEWLLVGGTLLPAVGLDVRVTVDIDLVGLGAKETSQVLELMEISEGLGLPIETINQAATFFVRKIGHQREDLLPLHRGERATIFRPSLALYWRLKLARFSETDAVDCQHYFDYCKSQADHLDFAVLKRILVDAARSANSQEKRDRIHILAERCSLA